MDNNMFKNLAYIKPCLFDRNSFIDASESNGGSESGVGVGIPIEDEDDSDITGHDIPGGN